MFIFIVNKSFIKRSSIISHISSKHSGSVPMVRAGHKTSPGSHPHSAGLVCRYLQVSSVHAQHWPPVTIVTSVALIRADTAPTQIIINCLLCVSLRLRHRLTASGSQQISEQSYWITASLQHVLVYICTICIFVTFVWILFCVHKCWLIVN